MENGQDSDWLTPPDLKAATRAQRAIAERCETVDRLSGVATIAGADISCKWRDSTGPVHAAIAPARWPAGLPLAPATATLLPRFPYVPGYLGFREAPALVAAWGVLADRPDLLFVDGHGRGHPRRCGVATHIGVLLDQPTIGIAKSLLCGRIEGDVGPDPGDRAPVIDRGEVICMALRTSARGSPIFVGIGHRVSLETAIEWALATSLGRRLPLPIRLAHDAANVVRRAHAAD